MDDERADRPPIIGRSTELGALQAAIDRVLTGRLGVVCIDGPAGIGKTLLLDEAQRLAETAGMAVRRARAVEIDSDTPFGMLTEALDLRPSSPERAAAHVGELLRNPERAMPGALGAVPEFHVLVIDQICALVEDLASSTPLALMLDDLQWVDRSTVDTVVQLMQRMVGLPLLIVATSRPTDTDSGLASIADGLAGDATLLTLTELSDHEVQRLSAAALGAPPAGSLVELIRRAGGNPFLVRALCDELISDGAVRIEEGLAHARSGGGSAPLSERVRARVRRWSSDVNAVLRCLAVLGQRAELKVIASLSTQDRDSVLATVRQLSRAGLVDLDADCAVFRHDLYSELIYADIPTSVRIVAHRDAARCLARHCTDATDVGEIMAIAGQWLRAPTLVDEDGAGWLFRAGLIVSPHDSGRALEMYALALDVEGLGGELRTGLEVAQVEATAWGAHPLEADQIAGRLLDRSIDQPRELREQLAYLRAVSNFLAGRMSEAASRYHTALEIIDSPMVRAQTLAIAAVAEFSSADIDAALDLSAQAVALGSAVGDRASVVLAKCVGGFASNATGAVGALEQVHEAVAIAEADESGRSARSHPWWYAAFGLIDQDAYDDAMELIERGRTVASSRGMSWALPLYDVAEAMVHLRQGALDNAYAACVSGARLGVDLRVYLVGPWVEAIASITRVHAGDIAAAQQHLARVDELSAQAPSVLGNDHIALARAMVMEASGDADAAFAHLYGAWSFLRALRFVRMANTVAVDLVRLAAQLHRADELGEVAAHLDELVQSGAAARRPWLQAARGLAVGCHRADPGLLADAVAAAQIARQPITEAVCLEARMRFDSASAAQCHRAAVATLRDVGAWHDVSRVNAQARRIGLEAIDVRVPRPATGWRALTAREVEISQLIAAGMSNVQVAESLHVSRRTVETHLHRVFAKLNVGSRTELALVTSRERRHPPSH